MVTQMLFEAEISPRKEHRSGDLCGAQAFKPVFRCGNADVTAADIDRFKFSAGHMLFNRAG
jgi:hypothetical protein